MATAANDAALSAQGQAQASPRKRRRRAPTTGAADDCFTCRDRGAPCDRRRPYCSQCLDLKITCSGYKTQLTWGVGVASRGKLRGLSLPVAKSKPAVGSEKPASRKNSSTSGGSRRTPKTPAGATSVPSSAKSQASSQATSTPSTAATSVSYSFVGVDPNTPAQSAPPFQTNFEWPPQHKYASSDVRTQPMRQELHSQSPEAHFNRPLKRHALHLDTSDIQPYHHQQPPSHAMTAQPALGQSYRPYDSPISPSPYEPLQPHHARYGSFSSHSGRPMHMHHLPNSNPGSAPLNPPNSWPSNYPSPSSTSDSGSHISTPDAAYLSASYPDASIGMAADQLLAMHHPQSYMPHNSLSFGAIDAIHEFEDEADEEIKRENTASPYGGGYGTDMLRLNQTFNSTERVGNTPELRYLINYYLEVLTPVILAFDGPGNPWREHVLSLARSSEGLQHAIAALSASNLRMRREHKDDKPRLPPTGDSVHDVSVRKSTEAHERLNDEIESPELSIPGAPSARESYHKTQSIRALNKQLADPSRRSDDSIVAILLVICLYHMCETGVARFRTQFAGVKRIMSLRAQRQAPSKEINWMITYFKWFDAMAATVNDRECQFVEESASLPLPDEDWGLENLAGCDSRLFATVSKLGRLNVLNQGRITRSSDNNVQPAYFSSPVAGPQAPHMHPDLIFDASGWAQLSPAQSMPTPGADTRNLFWTEWAQIRQDLVHWSFDPSFLPNAMRTATNRPELIRSNPNASPHTAFADKSVADISHISESFRHAALLYTERLAYPNLPSSANQFQEIVQTALHYIKLVKSDVCLLWPLFIVGTEAIGEDDRSAIRSRCWEIQKDSGFYNNIKTLELLEVIWDRTDKEGRGGNVGGTKRGWEELPQGTEAFRWRKEMKTNEGEYIVI